MHDSPRLLVCVCVSWKPCSGTRAFCPRLRIQSPATCTMIRAICCHSIHVYRQNWAHVVSSRPQLQCNTGAQLKDMPTQSRNKKSYAVVQCYGALVLYTIHCLSRSCACVHMDGTSVANCSEASTQVYSCLRQKTHLWHCESNKRQENEESCSISSVDLWFNRLHPVCDVINNI